MVWLAIGRGNDIVCYAINHVANMVVGKKIEDFFSNMGATYDYRKGFSLHLFDLVFGAE